jgi:phage terminase large subunit GpA-like protein
LIGTPTAIDVSQGGKKLRRGIKVHPVAVGIAKLEFYNNLRKSAEMAEDGSTPTYPAGYVHLPKMDAEYLQQLCAEQLLTRHDRNGYSVRSWQKIRDRNEALDCYVYARAAASNAGLDRFEARHWADMERQLTTPQQPGPPSAVLPPVKSVAPAAVPPPVGAAPPNLPQPRRRIIKSRWLG